MCLITKNKLEIQTAKEDFVVYKVMYHNIENLILSPYQFTEYEIGVEVITELDEMQMCQRNGLFFPITTILDSVLPSQRWYRSKQGLYSFSKKKHARKLKTELNMDLGKPRHKIYKCIVPKGSHYITDGTQFISDRLILKRKCII